MKRTLLGLASLTLMFAFTGCGDSGSDDDGSSDGTGDTDDDVGDGDGDTGDGDGDTGDGDGDTGDGDGDGDVDTDEDGVPDSQDNCPEIANPNQLDFDSNDAGNVCDPLMFVGVNGTLNTTANVDGGGIVGSCSIPLQLSVEDGTVLIQLDDDASVAGVEITNLSMADINDQNCSLIISVTVSLAEFMITNGGEAYPVSVAHTQEAHDAGSVAGDSDGPHPMLASAMLSAVVDGEPMASELNLDGDLPPFTLNVTQSGGAGTMAWADAQFVLATTTFEASGFPLDFDMTGLVGSLNLVP